MRQHTVVGGGGARLHVVEHGNPAGRPLVFLHGWSQCWLSWSAQLHSDLADDFRLVAVDLRGHGRSDKPADGYDDSGLWAADLHAVLTELDLHRPVVTGWSYGGLVICDYLRAHGDGALGGIQFTAAITKVGTPEARPLIGDEFLAAARRSFATDVEECVAGIRDYLDLFAAEPLSDEAAATVLGCNVLVPPWTRRRLFTRCVDNDDVLRAITVPTLISHGDQDRCVLPAAGRQHAALVPHAVHSCYADTGHAPFVEDPARFNRELRGFAAAL